MSTLPPSSETENESSADADGGNRSARSTREGPIWPGLTRITVTVLVKAIEWGLIEPPRISTLITLKIVT